MVVIVEKRVVFRFRDNVMFNFPLVHVTNNINPDSPAQILKLQYVYYMSK